MSSKEHVYLDHAATTPVDPDVIAAMQAVHTDDFGNPSSRHPFGLRADRRLRAAREVIAQRVNAEPEDVVFVSGGTEAIALAMLGGVTRRGAHVLVSAIEHSAARNTAKLMAQRGYDVQTVPVDARGGFVEPGALREMLRPDTALVVVMHVNNETGIEQPITEIGRMVRAHAPKSLMLVDAVQSFCKLPVDVAGWDADAVALSGHKINGPKGVGALVTRKGLTLTPLWGGGDQERGARPGTENVAGAVGMATAAERYQVDTLHARKQMATLLDAVWDGCGRARPLGSERRRVPWITAMEIPGVRSEVLVNALGAEGVFVSSGSACHGRRGLRSATFEAMGVPKSSGVLRLSIGRTTKDAEIERGAVAIRRVLGDLT